MDPIRVLVVDDDEEDFFIVSEYLGDAPGEFELRWCSKYSEAMDVLHEEEIDICLVDYLIGGDTGIDFVRDVRDQGFWCPMILLTGVGAHEVDLAASKVGAADFLDKGTLTPVLLERAIRYALEQARALQELSDQRMVLATTIESIQGGIATFDAQDNVVTSNSTFGLYMREASTFDTGHSIDADDPTEAARCILNSIPDRTKEHKLELETADGRAFECRVSPVPAGGSVMLVVDVTAQKLLQRKIMEAKVAAESANRSKSAFVARVSHELRTPMNGIFGMAQLVRLGQLSESQAQSMDCLLESAKALLALIEDLLDLSLIEQGEFSIHQGPVDIPKIVQDARDIARAAAHDRDLNVDVRIDVATSGEIVGDGTRIKQVLCNLLSNATKFTSQGEIGISVQHTHSGHYRFAVQDDGPGIAPEDHTRIFDAFTQVKSTPSDPARGVGLGLSIASDLVEKMEGKIGVNSEPGAGAEFWFEVPLRPATTSGRTQEVKQVAS